jgi:Zn finger protein HypA/HybF involved in hydrogenase expression
LRIRTRYLLFKIILGVAIAVFVLSLVDIFGNKSGLFIPVMITYVVLAVLALILYIGHKPDLEAETVLAAPEPVPDQTVVEEVTPRPALNVQGPHNFRCPFCANVFALELTHLRKEHDIRMDCPFCANTIRIPRRPRLSPGQAVRTDLATPEEQALFVCENCGEVLRYTAPGQQAVQNARVHTCPHCGSERVDPATGAAA